MKSALALPLFIGSAALAVAAQLGAVDPIRLPQPTYEAILTLREAAQPQDALTALEDRLRGFTDESMPLEALLLRADLLSATGRHEDSIAAWRIAARRDTTLAPLAQRRVVERYLASGSLQSALDALSPLMSAATAPAELLARLAGACRSAGLLDRAIALYRLARDRAGRGPLADETTLALAETLEQAGRVEAAVDILGELQLTFRRSSAYPAATVSLRRLSPSRSLTEDDYELIADRLGSVAAFRLAVEALEEWRRAFPETNRAQQIEASIIDNLYSLRANEDARARIEAFLERYPEGSEAVAARITLFRLDIREGRTAEAKSRGLAIWNGRVRGATASQRQGAARLLAEYLVAVGQPEEAADLYDQLVGKLRNNGDRMDVLWRTAIAELRADRRREAIGLLRRVLSMKPGSETFRATAYWLAEAESAEGQDEAAARRRRELAERYPYTYYGNRAAARLKEHSARSTLVVSAPALTFPRLSLTDTVLGRAEYRLAALLARAGLHAEAAVYARRLSAILRKDNAVALLAARAARAAGDHPAAAAIATAHFGAYLERPTEGLPEDLWELAYPRAFWPEVAAAASRHQVDPLLMLALARQESHFDHRARSPVGALGLFQIMPATAERMGAGLVAGPIGDDHLMRPGISAEIAARLLADLLKLFDGALAPAIASYNAGEERVEVWWEAARGRSEDLFVDSIPYRETRGYVRQVLANYGVYRRLAAQ